MPVCRRRAPLYEGSGLPELWLIDDVAETVLVFRRSAPRASTFDATLELAGDHVLRSPQLAGFELSLGRLFAA